MGFAEEPRHDPVAESVVAKETDALVARAEFPINAVLV